MTPLDKPPPTGQNQPDDVPSVIYRDGKVIRPRPDVRYPNGRYAPHKGTRLPRTRFDGPGLFDNPI